MSADLDSLDDKKMNNMCKKILNFKEKQDVGSILKWKKRLLICCTFLAICAITIVSVTLLNILSTPVSIVLWTMVFVFLLRGVVNGLERHRVNRVIGTAIAYLLMVLVFALICLFMFSPVFGFSEQIRDMLAGIPDYINNVKAWFQDIYSQYGHILNDERVQKWINDSLGGLGSLGGELAGASATGLISAGGAIGNFFMAIGIALVIAFWVLIELPSLGREVSRFIKPKYKDDAKMWQISFSHVMSGYIKGTFLQCFIIGVASGILFWILGIPNSGAFGCITGVLNIIPIFGPWIGGFVAGVGGIFTNVWVSLIALVGTICIQQFVYTFISPRIMSSSCNIHPALSLFALTIGAAIGGSMSGLTGSIVGMLLSIPAIAVIKSQFVYYFEKKTGVRLVSEKGVFFKGVPHDENDVNPMYDALSLSPKEIKEVERQEAIIDIVTGDRVPGFKHEPLSKKFKKINSEKKSEDNSDNNNL